MQENWNSVGIAPANILLPRENLSHTAWAVVACDQYTSQPAYWEETALAVGDQPSTLHITLPEIYLSESEKRMPRIHQTMEDYIRQGTIYEAVHQGFILIERHTGSGARLGLVVAADLDSYDFAPGSASMIRATEGTILSRIPPRLAIRKNAKMECTHVMLLMDDVMESVVEPLYSIRGELPVLYDFPLQMGGGHLKGWAVTKPELLSQVCAALTALKARLPEDNPLLFAVGDGNHSLATARTHWLELKKTLTPQEAQVHPARYALVEIENIHDDALTFEPIHRVVFHANGDKLMHDWTMYCHERGMDLSESPSRPGDQAIGVCYGGSEMQAVISRPEASLAVGTLQKFLDNWLSKNPGAEIDYIHGEETVRDLCSKPDTIGFLLPALEKGALLPAVRTDGALPRKTFSMGAAHEKRYYMECRTIR